MKRGWIAAVMTAVSLALGIFEYAYVERNTAYYLAMLDDADEKMKQNQVYDAQSVAERLEHRYKNEIPLYDIFMYHTEVADVSGHLVMLSKYAMAGDTAEFLATSALTRLEIENIRYSRHLKIDNIL